MDTKKILIHGIIWLVLGLAGTCWLLSGCSYKKTWCRHSAYVAASIYRGKVAVSKDHAQAFKPLENEDKQWFRGECRVWETDVQEIPDEDIIKIYDSDEACRMLHYWDGMK